MRFLVHTLMETSCRNRRSKRCCAPSCRLCPDRWPYRRAYSSPPVRCGSGTIPAWNRRHRGGMRFEGPEKHYKTLLFQGKVHMFPSCLSQKSWPKTDRSRGFDLAPKQNDALWITRRKEHLSIFVQYEIVLHASCKTSSRGSSVGQMIFTNFSIA